MYECTRWVAERLRKDLFAEVDARLLEDLEQDVAREHVDAHRGDERFVGVRASRGGAAGNAAADLRQPRVVRLLFERDDLSLVVEPEDAHLCGVGACDRLRGDRDVGAALDVRLDQLAEIHAIEMIAREDQEVVRVVSREVSCGLPDGVGRALEPVRALRGLLGGQHLDEAIREEVQPVGLRDVPVERRRVELRQDEDPLQAGVKGSC